MNANLINISDDKTLLQATDFLHDGYCDLSTVQYDEDTGIWKAIFEREFFEDEKMMTSEPRFLFFNKVSFPMVKSEFILEGIKTYKIEDKSNIQIYSFNECQVKDNIYRFYFNENMEIIFTFNDTPKGNLTDKELLNKKGSYCIWRNPFKQ